MAPFRDYLRTNGVLPRAQQPIGLLGSVLVAQQARQANAARVAAAMAADQARIGPAQTAGPVATTQVLTEAARRQNATRVAAQLAADQARINPGQGPAIPPQQAQPVAPVGLLNGVTLDPSVAAALAARQTATAPSSNGGLFSGIGDYLSSAASSVKNSGAAFIDDPSLMSAAGVVGSVGSLIPYVNKPYEWHAGIIGDVMFNEATKTGDSDWKDWKNYDPVYNTNADMQKWALDPANKQRIIDASTKGIDADGDGVVDLSGGDAVFSLFFADKWHDLGDNDIGGFVDMLVSNAVIDPLTWAAMGAGGAASVVRSLGAKAATGAELTSAEKTLLFAARAAETTLTVPNAVADAPFTAIAKVGGLGNKVLRGAFDTSAGELRREAEGARITGIEEANAASALPDDTPVVAPQVVEHAPVEGPLALPQPRLESFEPRTNVLPDGQEIAVTPSGQGAIEPPVQRAGPEPVVEPQPPDVPVRESRGHTYIGPSGEYRVKTAANGKAILDVRNERGRYIFGATFDTPAEAIDQATEAIRTRDAATAPEPVQPQRDSWGDTRRAPRTYETPDARNAAIAANEITQYTPVSGGSRPIDRVYDRSFNSPKEYTAYKNFEAEVTAPLQASKQRQVDISSQRYPLFDEKKAREALNGIDAVVDTIVPGIKRHFPDEPLDPLAMSSGRMLGEAGEKASFRDENIGYLIQRAVFEGDDNALRVANQRLGGAIPDLEQTVQGQRAKLARALSAVNLTGDLPLSGGTQAANAAFRAQEEARFRPVQSWNDLIRRADERVRGLPVEPLAPLDDVLDQTNDAVVTADPLVRTPDVIERWVNNGRLTPDAGDALLETVTYRKTPKSQPREGTVIELYDDLYAATDPSLPERRRSQMALDELERGIRVPGAPRSKAGARLRSAVRTYDTISQAAKEGIQYNIVTGARGSIGDALGDGYSLLVRGHPMQAVQSVLGPVAELAGIAQAKLTGREGTYSRIMRAVDESDGVVLNDLPELAPVTEYGLRIPQEFLPRSVGQRADVRTTGEMTIKPITGPFSGILANKTLRNLRTGLDLHRRVGLWSDQVRRGLGESLDRWQTDHLDRVARKEGVDPSIWMDEITARARLRSEESGKRWWGGFEPEDVRVVTGSDELARQLRGELNRLSKAAKATVDSILFSYKRTNADEVMSRVAFFHYWQSRALAMHARAAIKNPWLLATYYRTWQSLKERAERDNYPDSVKGYLQFMGDSANGWYGMFNPAGIVVPFTMFSEGSSNEDAPFWEKVGVFLNPLVEGAAAAMGLVDSVPDPTGTSTVRNTIIAADNWAKAHDIPLFGGDALTEDRIRGIEQAVYEKANGAFQSLGITDKEYGPYDPHNTQVVQIRSRIQQLAEAEYGDPATWTDETKDLVQDAMARVETGTDGNPLSEQAFEDFTDAQLGGTVARSLLPGGVRVAYAPLEADRDLSKAGYDAIAAGQDPTAEEQAAMGVQGQVNAGSPEDAALERQRGEYASIGTERQKNLNQGWINIAHADDLPVGYYTIDGKTIDTRALMKLSTEERTVLADRWVANHEGTDELAAYRDERDAYIAEHPEYGDFDDYADAVRQYNGGPSQFRKDLAAQNDNFARALAEQEAKWKGKPAAIRKKELDNWTDSMAAYEAASGIQGGIYDEDPIDTGPGWKSLAADDKVLRGDGGYGGGSSSGDRVSRLKRDLAEYETKRVLFEQATGYRQEDVMNNPIFVGAYKSRGLWVDMPQNVELYLQWQALQSPGTDTSPEAFYAFVDSLTKVAA